MANRLASATSPYLLQHADNPVDWWEWGEPAFAEARRRDVPILLSVGYAACHWCHVMAHESFEDEEVAAAIDAGYVAVKVDREERPDVDAVYMAATTMTTGRGGWPMTCLITPDGEPFHCGTYYPREQLLRLLAAAAEAWTGRRGEIADVSAALTDALEQLGAPTEPHALDEDALAAAVEALSKDHDERHGGFGTAPKFPPSMVLEHLLRHHDRTSPDGTSAGPAGSRALRIAGSTCVAMARGGIHDQLAGGFARYAVDAAWTVPHFEKMLYDNAQLLGVYLHLARSTPDDAVARLAERVARGMADFLLRDLRTDEGGFASALDADTAGEEGLTYVWTPAQLVDVLGDDDGARAAALLGVTEDGTFEAGASTLRLLQDPDDDWWSDVRLRLLRARSARPQPARDDKVVAAWNGLAIGALARAGSDLGDPRYVSAAQECADLLLRVHLVDGRLRRVSRDGVVGDAAGLAVDHGNVAQGLLALHQVDADPRWLRAAGDLLDTALEVFADPDGGGFHDVAVDAEKLITRPRDVTDNAEPSGTSALAGALLTYAALTASTRHRAAAEAALASAGALALEVPRFAGWSLAVAEALAAGPLEVAVVGPDTGPGRARRDELEAVVRAATSPGLVLAVGEPDTDGIPLLAGRGLVGGEPAAYVCRGHVCDRPVSTAAELEALLRR
ncbi:thioredoxin domain-containing protein [Georgenia sp. Z1491]|uniref:thioredoxin domain-containing protein n=1 Tax=Georgenia sp. Z1491 TaxID=3416707 RepID=UPI003CE9D954